MCRVTASELRLDGGCFAVGLKDGILEREEGFLSSGFAAQIARDGDIDYTAGRYGRGKENGGKFDLKMEQVSQGKYRALLDRFLASNG